ncbi:MAG: ATP-dependent helicase HrpB [Verrucomicrobiota bacterium]
MPERLPIYDIETDFVATLKATNRLVLQAPTGSGKSTQVPQMLLRHSLLGNGQCVVLQPRRLAARMLASRVAHELNVPLGREVGYQVRFENYVSDATRIKFETEGILLRQLIADPTLKGITAIVFDEFHERHLYGDITLARALDIQEQHRPDLLIIVMSATLNADELEDYLSKSATGNRRPAMPCAVLRSEGRTYPVDVSYLPHRLGANPPPPWELAADAFSSFVSNGGKGDVLVFMPGGFEISQTIQAISNVPESRGYLVLPLHGELSPRDQDAAVARYEQPKVVVSTNVAETSVTIDGVRLVIDCGLARIARYDANRGINTLLIERISQASSDQRAGRAGRTAPGKCFRLWSRPEHDERAPQELPEIKRLDLSEVVLTLKAAGVEDLRNFRWLEKPDEISLTHAQELLEDLGALDHAGRISPIGRKMLAFPTHPRYSRMLLAAQEYGCVHQACLVAALTQGRDLLMRGGGKDVQNDREDLLGEKATSDFWILMRAWTFAQKNQFRLDACRRLGIHAVTAKQVGPLFEQFLRIARDEGLDTVSREIKDEALQKCILIGFSDRVARRLDQGTLRCELVHGRRGLLARESVVSKAELFVAAEIREIEQRGGEVNTLLSIATAIELDWLKELFPEDIKRVVQVQWDAQAKRVLAAELVRFRDLALAAKRIDPPPADAAARLLAEEINAGRLPLPNWDHSVEQWLLRLKLLCQHCADLQLPPITDDDKKAIIEQLCHGAVSYKDIKEREVKPVVMSWLSHPQRELLDKHAPERLTLSNGRTPKVSYEEGRAPFISLRIQELYDVNQTPKIALGRVGVTVHILTPGMKPIQVTSDLANFWREHYPKIKSELQRRYPKHEWR